MEIRPEVSIAQSQSRPNKKLNSTEESSVRAQVSPASTSRSDSAEVQSEKTAALVHQLKSMDVGDVHRLNELKEAIGNGSYNTDPSTFADQLLDALDQEAL